MAATVQIISLHGATYLTTESPVQASTTRFKVADNATVDANNPIPIPTGADNYSFIKQLQLKTTVAPSNLVDNVKFYTDATGYGATISLMAKTYATGSYVNPATQGTTALTATTDAFTYTAGAPLTVAGSTATTANFSDIVALQMGVTNTAAPGTTAGEVLTFSYDES